MARPNFFNENQGRYFPLVQDSMEQPPGTNNLSWLPKPTFVDFGAVMGVNAGYSHTAHHIRLVQIRRNAGRWYFYFIMVEKVSEANVLQHWLVFSRSVGETEYVTSFEEAIPLTQDFPETPPEESASVEISASVNPCPQTIPWSGYLTTGDLTDLEAWMGADIIRNTGYAVVEPALIQSQDGSFVNTINIANADRTRADSPSWCRPLVWTTALDDVYIAATCVTGRLRFEGGYNTNIQQQTTENRIRFAASVGEGAGEVCDPVPLFPGERPPLGGSNLDGALSCNDTIRSINGVGGRTVQLLAGAGVSLSADPANNLINVAVDLNSLKACIDLPPDESGDCVFSVNASESCGPIF